MTPTFAALRKELEEIRHLGNLINLAHWDQQVNLPARGFPERGAQIGLLAKLKHDRLSSAHLFELTSELLTSAALTPDERTATVRLKEELDRVRKRPADLVEAIAAQESETHNAWLVARKAKDFSLVQQELEKMLRLKREYASRSAPHLSPYDALVEDFEVGSRSHEIFQRFERLKASLFALREKNLGSTPGRKLSFSLPKELQEKLFHALATDLGFDLTRGRLDPTVHPFAAELGTNDVRLTTNYSSSDLTLALYGFIHEMGHGLYDQGLAPEWAGTPLGEACSLAIHESQSLLYEKNLGLSRGFLSYLSGKLSELSPTLSYSPESLFEDLNRLSINLVRLQSDEIGYAFHIILRTELEQALVNGDLPVADLPAAWAEKTVKYFGRAPQDDLEGVLQDVHWYGGAFGYFPHYLGGAMYAAQLMETFKQSLPEAASLQSTADFAKLLTWLRTHIHHQGRALYAEELIESVTGSKMNEGAYLKYLSEKYSS